MTKRWTDADFARKCRQNDAQAWRVLIGQHGSSVYRLAVRMLQKGWEADDATQETFLRVHRSINTFDPTRPLRPWILRIAYNVCLRRLGKAKKDMRANDPTELNRFENKHEPDPEKVMSQAEQGELIVAALNKIAAQDRALLIMHYREELSLAEVAQTTGISVNTIKTRMHRARNLLRRILSPVLRKGNIDVE